MQDQRADLFIDVNMKVFWVFFYAFSLVPFHSQSWHGLFYKLGLRGSYPHHTYQSSEVVSPILNIEQLGSQCSNDYVLLSLHGWAMPAPGTLILDGSGNVVWMETRFGTVMDLKVQRFEGADYLTFWAGAKDEGYGQGVYYMVSGMENNPTSTTSEIGMVRMNIAKATVLGNR